MIFKPLLQMTDDFCADDRCFLSQMTDDFYADDR
jgi:hypothetical protein